MRNKAISIGAIAYDDLFGVYGDIKNEIPLKDGKIGSVNLMFTAKSKKRFYGGTAANIAYGLALQGEKPFVFSCVGHDFYPQYDDYFKNLGIETRVYNAGKNHFTAVFYGISDEVYQQIGIFQPNAHGDFMNKISLCDVLSDDDFDRVKIAIFTPGTAVSTLNHMKEFSRATNGEALAIFDPEVTLSVYYTQNILKECFKLANIVIGNEIEIAQFKSLFDFSVQDILNCDIDCVIETLGDKGSRVYSKDGSLAVAPVSVTEVVETTGAGDAFRAGLIKGLLDDLGIEEACKIGSLMGARCAQYKGAQTYSL